MVVKREKFVVLQVFFRVNAQESFFKKLEGHFSTSPLYFIENSTKFCLEK
jgi:hypothetical protein